MGAQPSTLLARCLAEVIGTFILIFFGGGAVHAAILMEAHSGLWQVSSIWGVGVMLAIYTVGGVSGAHINPAITIALALWGRFSWGQVVPYVLSQVGGAFLASSVLFVLFQPYIKAKEDEKKVIRGQPGSEITAMCYGEYFPDPGGLASSKSKLVGPELQAKLRENEDLFPAWAAFVAEVVGTMILAAVVFALTDERNQEAPAAKLAPLFIGFTVAGLVSVLGPLTQSCLNPARDFGPRLFTCVAGWGSVAIPGPRGAGFLTVYIIAPIVGACIGGGLYSWFVRPYLPPLQEKLP